MADVLTIYEGSPSDTNEATIATIDAGKAFIMQGIIISNSNAADQTATVKIGTDTIIIPAHTVPKNDSICPPFKEVPILAGKTIKFTSSVANDLDFYIWGITIDV